METLSKREFYARYANKRDKGNILVASILAYICAAITLAVGLLMQNYYILIDVVLIIGLTLGIQIGKSRACAVILLVYSCISTLLGLINTGKVTGWWLIIVGIWAIMGTFNLQKDYRNYLRQIGAPVS